MARRSSSAKSTSRKQTGARSTRARSAKRGHTGPRRRGSRQQARAFAARLTSVMQERGLTNAETAQRIREHLPEGEGFSPANISHYRSGRSVPRSSHLEALSQALGVKSSDLVTESETSKASSAAGESGSARERPTARGQGARRKGSSSRRRVTHTSGKRHAEPEERVTMLEIEDLGTKVRIRFDELLPWDKGMRLIQALKASGVT